MFNQYEVELEQAGSSPVTRDFIGQRWVSAIGIKMKVWFISDTHGRHRELNVPDYDLVIHCGDEANSLNPIQNEKESLDFFSWFESLPAFKIFVPGNHSTAIERKFVRPNVQVLIDSYIYIEELSISIYGSPWTPSFGNSKWAYHRDRKDMHKVWESIPKCDILATHGPPKGILDIAEDRGGNNCVHCGCRSLQKKVFDIRPSVHCFGHIHSHEDNHNAGIYQNNSTKFINCSVVDNSYNLIGNGFVLDFIA